MSRREGYDGPLIPLRAKAAALLVAFVAVYGYCTDHHVHTLQGLVVAVVRDFGGAARHGGGHEATRQPAPSATAVADIPRDYLAAYRSAARTCPHLTWALLAGIGKHESNHGRGWPPRWAATRGIRSGDNGWGAAGPMQIGTGGASTDTWGTYGDGVRGHVYDIRYAAPAAARKLCADGVRAGRTAQAVFAYNHSARYVGDVLATAHSYARSR